MYINNSVSDHKSSSSYFLSQTPYYDIVHLPNGSHIDTLSIGFVQVNPYLYINNVLRIPSFQVNLLSVSKLTCDLNYIITFHSNFCILQNLSTMKMIGLEKEHNGLYYLSKHITIKPPSEIWANAIFTIPDLWHYCLGHPSTAPFQFLSKTIPNFSFHPNMHYKICFMVKQTRLPFNLSSISSHAPFDLIHCDI